MSVEEDKKLLQAVREWRPPTTVHPMAMKAWHVYEKHEKKLTPAAAAELRGLLDAYLPDLKALAEALEGVCRTMIIVSEHEKDQAGAAAIADVMRSYSHHFEPFWQMVGEAMQNVGVEAKGLFMEFLAAERAADKTAPVFGAAAPEGSVPLRNLAPIARPPPWAGKAGKADPKRPSQPAQPKQPNKPGKPK